MQSVQKPVKQVDEKLGVIAIFVISFTLALPAQAHQSYWYGVTTAITEDQTVKLIEHAEESVSDVQGWANDLLRALKENKLARNKENVCSMIAVIDQESGFVANPTVPNLGEIASKKVIEKLHKNRFALGYLVIGYLESNPTIGRSYLDQISANAHEGLDQQTCEARAYAVARKFNPLLVNTVVGFIGPEYLYDGKQIIRAGLEDHFLFATCVPCKTRACCDR